MYFFSAVDFEEVEDTLREITAREAGWGGVLSGGPAVPDRGNGTDTRTINGRAGARSKPLTAGVNIGVGVGASSNGGDVVPGSRTLV